MLLSCPPGGFVLVLVLEVPGQIVDHVGGEAAERARRLLHLRHGVGIELRMI